MAAAGRKSRGSSNRGSRRPPSNWIYGFHPVREALRARRRRLERLWLRAGPERPDHRELAALAREAGIPVEVVDRTAIDAVAEADVQTQGIALEAGPIPELSLSELIAGTKAAGAPAGSRIVALDGVEDPHNVGAVARVAESSGAAGLVLTERRAPDLTAAVSKASAGAIEWLPVARVSNLSRALSELKDAAYWILAAAPEEGASLFEVEDRILTGNLVLVLGAEGKGVRPGVLRSADHAVEIPMQGRIGSLNVSTAGAVILYDLLRRSTRGS